MTEVRKKKEMHVRCSVEDVIFYPLVKFEFVCGIIKHCCVCFNYRIYSLVMLVNSHFEYLLINDFLFVFGKGKSLIAFESGGAV